MFSQKSPFATQTRFNWVEKSIEARLDSIHVDQDKARWWYEELKKSGDI